MAFLIASQSLSGSLAAVGGIEQQLHTIILNSRSHWAIVVKAKATAALVRATVRLYSKFSDVEGKEEQ